MVMSTSPAWASTQSLWRAREVAAGASTAVTEAEPAPSAGCQDVGRRRSTTLSCPGNSSSPLTLAP